MIVSGGENVYSIEVENALSTHPAVAEVAVIGVPHDTWGEQVHAVVVLHPGAAATTEDLQEHARKTIAGYKVPKTIEFRSEPMPLSGASNRSSATCARNTSIAWTPPLRPADAGAGRSGGSGRAKTRLRQTR